jgi:DNA invertase Pin-like site-specific DNA recombinase
MVGNGCDIAVKSGAAGTRWPEFDAALAHLRAEDILVVWKRDGLSRSLDEIIAAIDGFTPEPGYHDKLRNRLCGCRPFCKRTF